ncbi:hypothetical protein GCM10023189_07660 [Nibrella saemangeumensis]|uniref:Lipocalin-like domain-containing protein n=1 Tax=Nibrella saemangeumensis TaxID=1084526 RepID=A0ABP8MGT6_9BACT
MKRFAYLLALPLGLGLLLGMVAFRTATSTVAPSFVSKAWTVQSVKLDTPVDFNGDGQPDSELLSFMSACEKDDALIFEANSNLITDKGSLRCRPDEPHKELTAHWIYDPETQVISLVDLKNDSEMEQWQVLESTAGTLKIRFDILPSDGQTSLKATMTLQAVR